MPENAPAIDSAAILDALIPSVKMVVAPHIIIIKTGTTYTRITYPRPVILEPLDPATAGIIYTNPNTNPSSDAAARQTQGGAFLYAKGDWFVRHSAATDQSFRVDDAGGSGASTQTVPSPTPAAAAVPNRTAWYTAQTSVPTPSTAVQCAAQAVPDGFSVLVTARVTNTGNVGLGNSAANADLVTGTPTILGPGSSRRLYITNVNLVFVDAIVANEGVDITVEV